MTFFFNFYRVMPLVRFPYGPTLNYMTQRAVFVLVLVPLRDETELMKQIWKSFLSFIYELLIKISRLVVIRFLLDGYLQSYVPFSISTYLCEKDV